MGSNLNTSNVVQPSANTISFTVGSRPICSCRSVNIAFSHSDADVNLRPLLMIPRWLVRIDEYVGEPYLLCFATFRQPENGRCTFTDRISMATANSKHMWQCLVSTQPKFKHSMLGIFARALSILNEIPYALPHNFEKRL